MTFTNDDLERLKRWVDYCESKFNGRHLDDMTFVKEMSYTEVKTLLVRLEAAEKLAEQRSEECCTDYVNRLAQEWRRAAGK